MVLAVAGYLKTIESRLNKLQELEQKYDKAGLQEMLEREAMDLGHARGTLTDFMERLGGDPDAGDPQTKEQLQQAISNYIEDLHNDISQRKVAQAEGVVPIETFTETMAWMAGELEDAGEILEYLNRMGVAGG